MNERTTKNKAIIRKAIGLLVCLAMVAIMLPANVAKATSTTTQSVIDTTKSGSLTIHKYEYTDATAIAGLPAGTGEQQTITTTDKLKALSGVGFTLYKAKNVTVQDYYNGSSTATLLPDIKTNTDYYYSKNATTGAITVNTTNFEEAKKADGTTPIGEKTTGATGEAVFDTLPLGIYLVVETTPPVAVTTPVEPFVVSIPMTKVNSTEWLYDVHVYPKNKTAYGSVTVKKTGDGVTTGLEGVIFRLQKWNGTAWEDITDPADSTKTYTERTTDQNGEISLDGFPHGTYRLIERSVGDNAGYIMDGKTSYQFKIDEAGDVYKLVGDVAGNPTETKIDNKILTINNEKPDIEKKVLKKGTGATADAFAKEADYSVGDTIQYQSTFDVPENIADLVTFKIKDEPTNIKVDTSTIVIKDGTTEVPAAAYKITQGSTENGFTIDFKDASITGATTIATYKGKTLTLTYSAKLTAAPTTITVGNTNTIKLDYSDVIKPDATDTANPNKDITTVTTSEITDTATVFSFELKVTKTAEDGSTKLQNVEFDLYKQVGSTTPGAITGDPAGALGLDNTKYWLKVNTTSLKTDANGVVSQTGLANGTYYLVETKTVSGYNLLSKPVEVSLAVDYTVTRKSTYTALAANTPSGINKQLIKSEVNTTTFTKDGTAITGTATIGTDVNIKNSKGFTLPTTGGAGGFLFTLIGCCIMIVGIIIFYKSRNKQAAN